MGTASPEAARGARQRWPRRPRGIAPNCADLDLGIRIPGRNQGRAGQGCTCPGRHVEGTTCPTPREAARGARPRRPGRPRGITPSRVDLDLRIRWPRTTRDVEGWRNRPSGGCPLRLPMGAIAVDLLAGEAGSVAPPELRAGDESTPGGPGALRGPFLLLSDEERRQASPKGTLR